MEINIKYISLVINDYDEAIAYYTSVLNFELIEDSIRSKTKRWVIVKPKGSKGIGLLLAKAKNESQISRIGNQTGGRVFLFLHTDNFDREYTNLLDQNVKIIRPYSQEAYGKVAVFEDLYGNLWDLIEPNNQMV